MKIKLNNIDEYIETSRPEVRDKLYEIRTIIKSNAPLSVERISWDMPTFWQEGNICHFAVFKNHIGFYPGSSGVEHFLDELKDYKTSKGAIQFPLDKPLPKKLISRIVKYRLEENLKEAKAKGLK